MRQPVRGLNDIDKAIALDPEELDNHRTRGYILEAMGQRKAAIEEYRRILRREPGDRSAEAGLVRLRAPKPAAKATQAPKKLR
jgi:regulator of sirC expression with transglutaminase-like and TPR domain